MYHSGFNYLLMIHDVIHDTSSYTQLSSVIYRHKKGLNPLDLSLFSLYDIIFSHIKLGIWWRWRELNPRPPALRSRILHA